MSQDFDLILDIGGTKIRSALWDGHQLSEIHDFPTPQASVEVFVEKVNKELQEQLQGRAPRGLAMASLGPINTETGEISSPVNLGRGHPSWKRVKLLEQILPQISMDRVIDNDAAMAAWGHYQHFEKQKISDLLVVTLGTGMGVGAVIDHALVRGGQGMHPEVGHMVLSDLPDTDYSSPFGEFLTVESFLSGHHFSKRIGRLIGRDWDGRDLTAKENQGLVLQREWQRYSRLMAISFLNWTLMYYPQKIVLAGGFVTESSPFFLEQSLELFQSLWERSGQSLQLLPQVQVSREAAQLPLYGAAYWLQKQRMDRQRR